ncbi:hypothetical protein ACOMHN_050535 [Nucella lapillus]
MFRHELSPLVGLSTGDLNGVYRVGPLVGLSTGDLNGVYRVGPLVGLSTGITDNNVTPSVSRHTQSGLHAHHRLPQDADVT